MKKINLGILFGGRSCEHEVSVVSARSVLAAIDQDKYNVSLVAIDKQGHWHLEDDFDNLVPDKSVREIDSAETIPAENSLVTLDLHNQGNLSHTNRLNRQTPELDVIFPVLHGTFGEDGTIQGVFEMAGIPYVGCGVAASAIAMDKALAKRVFAAAGIPQAPSMVIERFQWDREQQALTEKAVVSFGYPMFIKPANLGSSVGVGKAHDAGEFLTCMEDALRYDNKVIVEQSMENCHEVECAILGNEEPAASVVGEIIPGAEFYDYQTKYIDDKSRTLIPAEISAQATRQVQELSIAAFRAIDGSGLARVDFFVHRETDEVFLNEINTLPGFTPISMYPKMWAASGIPYAGLIDQLVDLALQRQQARAALKRSF